MPLPTWIGALIALAETLDPDIAPMLNLGVALYNELTSGVDFSQPVGFPPIPGSVKGHKGTWAVNWTPTP